MENKLTKTQSAYVRTAIQSYLKDKKMHPLIMGDDSALCGEKSTIDKMRDFNWYEINGQISKDRKIVKVEDLDYLSHHWADQPYYHQYRSMSSIIGKINARKDLTNPYSHTNITDVISRAVSYCFLYYPYVEVRMICLYIVHEASKSVGVKYMKEKYKIEVVRERQAVYGEVRLDEIRESINNTYNKNKVNEPVLITEFLQTDMRFLKRFYEENPYTGIMTFPGGKDGMLAAYRMIYEELDEEEQDIVDGFLTETDIELQMSLVEQLA